MNITITDQNTDAAATVPAHDVADTITPWFDGAPTEVTTAIADLESALLRGDHAAHGLAEYLGLTIEQA